MSAVRPTKATLLIVAGRDEGRCARCGYEVTGERGEDWSLHHRRPAGMGGDTRPETHAPGNLVLLHGTGTRDCHGVTESYRADSQKRGFLIPKGAIDRPELWAIEHAVHGWCYLLDDGTVSTDPPQTPPGEAPCPDVSIIAPQTPPRES